MLRFADTDRPASIVSGVEEQLRARLDADMADGEKERASGSAKPGDAEFLAALIVLRDDRIEVYEQAAPAVALR